MEIFNLFHGELDEEPHGGEPPGYELGRAARVGKKIGASQMGLSIYEPPKGQAVCPYHFEWTDEEWLIVLGGRRRCGHRRASGRSSRETRSASPPGRPARTRSRTTPTSL